MTNRALPLLAVLALASACARPADEPDTTGGEQGRAGEPLSVAQATAGKPLIHVWKSPT